MRGEASCQASDHSLGMLQACGYAVVKAAPEIRMEAIWSQSSTWRTPRRTDRDGNDVYALDEIHEKIEVGVDPVNRRSAGEQIERKHRAFLRRPNLIASAAQSRIAWFASRSLIRRGAWVATAPPRTKLSARV
jgi:hypothetical protein